MEDFLAIWDLVCSDYEVRWMDDTNIYTGDDEVYNDISLTALVEKLYQDERLEYQPAEIWALDDEGDPRRDVPLLFWDGSTWGKVAIQ